MRSTSPLPVLLLVALLALPAMPTAAQSSSGAAGVPVSFHLTRFNDTLFASVTTAYRVQFDATGDVWYTTQSGLVHVARADKTRELYSHLDGLPSSLALGLAIDGARVYVGTDLGLAVVDRTKGQVVQQLRSDNANLTDDIIHEVAAIDGKVWMGTHFGGVDVWDPTTGVITSKNTSTGSDFAQPVKRIVATDTTVWVGTDGDGAWKYVKATGNWSHLGVSDGLPSDTVLAIAEMGGKQYFGTDKGLVEVTDGRVTHKWNATTSGMPDDRVYDLDVIPRASSGVDLWAATQGGMWQLDPSTGANQTRAQDFGVMGAYVFDDTFDEAHQAWAFGTTLGVSVADSTGWSYYSTGPTNGASPGPIDYRFTAATAADGLVWVGGGQGVSAFQPPGPNSPLGVWYNLGAWQAYPGGEVNHIVRYGNTTWFATNTEAVGYDSDQSAWVERKASGSRNVVYGLDAGQGELWVGLFGDGLIMQNLTTGLSRSWGPKTQPTALPDVSITDVRIQGNDVWLGSAIGVIRMDRIAGTIKATYTTKEGIPGDGIVFRVLPDGPKLYVGTKNGGVAQLDIASGQVDRVWDNKTVPGWPMKEARDLYREGGRLWVGTKDGLARVNLTTGAVTLWNQTSSKLVQNFVSGITSQDGILYLATASGIARLDIATDQFLPMRDGPTTQHGAGTGATTFTAPVSVRIDSPRDGVGVTGTITIKGAASHLGSPVDRVEVRIGSDAAPWQPANGTTDWTFAWDTTGSTPNQPITISARAFAGNLTSGVTEVLVTPVAVPKTPLTLKHVPTTTWNAGRPLVLQATATGDEPLAVALYDQLPGRDGYDRIDMDRQGSVFTATIPGRNVGEGQIHYYLVATSGLLQTTRPDDISRPYVVDVGPPARVAVAIEGPRALTAEAGQTTRFTLNVTNVGTETATYDITSSGLRATWVSVPPEPFTLAPGQSTQVNGTISVPLRAFADNTTLQFDVRDSKGEAQTAEASVPVQVLAAPDITTQAAPTATTKPSPAPALGATLALALAVALALRRRRS